MMKGNIKKGITFIGVLLMGSMTLWAQNTNNAHSPKKIQISFLYSTVSGYSTNQFAIWIENASGELIKTIYVTQFTATKGWKNRPESIPVWVKKSNVAKMKKNETDAISGVTPKSGEVKYYWDFTDAQGKTVADDHYSIVTEGTFDGSQKNPSEVLYQALVTKGKTINIEAKEPVYKGSSKRGKNMLSKVKYDLLE